MNRYLIAWGGCLLALLGADVQARDVRLRSIPYDAMQVVPLDVEPGFAVQIALGDDERIEAAGSGENSHCDDTAALWCVVARAGEHDIYVNAHPNAGATNLFVHTNKRDYSFDLVALPTGRSSTGRRVYRVTFTYPGEEAERRRAALARERSADQERLLEARLAQMNPSRNWNYTMQVMPGGDEIAPTMMYDDGRFTYIRFPNNEEIPAIYMVNDDGTSSLVQWHMEREIMVVHRVAKRFVLRGGTAVVGLWNEAYDPQGVAPHDGVTVPGVGRSIIKESSAARAAPSANRATVDQESPEVPHANAAFAGLNSATRAALLQLLQQTSPKLQSNGTP